MKIGATQNFADVFPWILCAGLAQAGAFVQALARSLERLTLWFWLRVLSTWNYAAVLILFALTTGLGVRTTGIAMCAGAACTTAVGVLFLYGRLHPITPSREVASQIVRYGAKVHPATIAMLSRDQLDKVILILLVSASEVGKYVVALALSSLIVSAAFSVDQAVFPRLSAILDFRARRRAYLRVIKWCAPSLIFVAPVILVVAPRLAALVFGDRFADQPWLIVCGGALGLLNTAKVLANIGLKIENRPGLLGVNETAGSIIGLTALPILVKAIGILGAPLAAGVGASVSLGLTARAIFRQYAEAPGPALPTAAGPSSASAPDQSS
jgi:O-antigen/teichoic acid export membrane protein